MDKTKAKVGAATLGVSMFVGATSIFVAVMAFGIARFVDDPALCRWMGVAAIVVCLVSFARARRSPIITVVMTLAFIAINAELASLYIRSW